MVSIGCPKFCLWSNICPGWGYDRLRYGKRGDISEKESSIVLDDYSPYVQHS
jgi:hypothetical protein